MNNGDYPAMPITSAADYQCCGLSKHEYFVALAMQGLLANPDYDPHAGYLGDDSVNHANAVLAELEKTP